MNNQATKSDIKEGVEFITLKGRVGKAYAVTQRKIDEGIVDLFFEGEGDLQDNPPMGMFRIETLKVK